MKRNLIKLLPLTIMLLVLAAYVSYHKQTSKPVAIKPVTIVNPVATKTYQQDPVILAITQKLGLATANFSIPRIFQIVVTANNANTATYSVGYNIMRG